MIKTTIFIPLSGRQHCWSKLSASLDAQTVDRSTTKLVLLNTDRHQPFGNKVVNWLNCADYAEKVYVQKRFSDKSRLADLARLAHLDEVNRVMIDIYTYAKRYVEGEYVFVIEDDIVPPPNAFEQLVGCHGPDVFSVSAVYYVRHTNKWVVWRDVNRVVSAEGGVGVEQVQANGFGCVVIGAQDFLDSEFTYTARATPDPAWPWGFDMEYFSKQTKKVLVNWGVFCEHLVEPKVLL